MAGPFYKIGAGTNLALPAQWSLSSGGPAGTAVPSTNETAIFDASSGTVSGLTGLLSIGGSGALQISGSTAASHSGGLTIGIGGITFNAGTTRTFTESGTLTTSGAQDWTIRGNASTAALTFSGNVTGSGTITIKNPDATAGLAAYFSSTTPASTSTATFILDNDIDLGIAATSGNAIGTGATVRVVGSNCLLYSAGTGRVFSSALSIENDCELTLTGRSMTYSGAVAFVGATRTVTISGDSTISGTITGTAGFTKSGTGALTIANSNPALNNTLSGLVTASTGRVQFGNWVENTSASTVSPEQLPYTDISIASTAEVTLSVPATTAYTTAVDYSGDGQLAVVGPTTINANGLTFTGSIAALGPAVPEHSKGLYLRSNQLTANNKAIVTVKDLPRCVTYFHGAGGATTTFEQAIYMDTAAIGAVYPTKIFVRAANATIVVASPIQRALYASQLTGAIEIQGGIDRIDEAGTSFPANLTFHLGGGNTEDNKVSGPITNTSRVLNIAKIDSGRWILSGQNTYTGTTSITAGTLSAQGVAGTRTPLGGSGAVTVTAVTGSGTLDISSTDTTASSVMSVNKAGTALSLGGTGTYQLTSTTGFNEYVCAGVTLNTTLPVNISAGAYLRMGNTAAMAQSGGTWGITKTGDGEYNLGTTSNTFAGTVTVTGGTLSFEASVPSGAISPLGNATSAIVLSGTTLKYRGAGGHTLGRAVSLSGSPSFDASGTGAVTFSPAITHAAGARTITFKGSSTNDNTFTTALTNNGGDAVSVTKTEAGKWILSGAPSYAGDTTVSGGTLTFNGQTVQQNVVMNGTGVLDDTVLAGVKNITCNGGTPEIKAATAGNTVSGATSITSGSLRVTTEIRDGGKPVKVLGDTDVTVTGTLQTTKGTLQRGQMRYGGDLTFSAGSTLRIG